MAAATPLFSSLFGDATKWDNYQSDYGILSASFGRGTAATSLQAPLCRDGLAQLATRTPVVVAFVSDTECDYIYVAHSFTLFPGDVTDPTPMDNLAVALIGDRLDHAVPVVLPQPFFSVCPTAAAYNVGIIQGAIGHGAAPAVFRHGPHALGDPDTNDLRARRALLLPPHLAGLALRSAPADGRFTLLHFFNTFLQATLASGDAAAIAALEPVTQWWRLASTNTAGGASVVSSPLLAVTSPRAQSRLNAWASRVKNDQMSRIGIGGPGLSNAAFAQGVNVLTTTMEATHRASLEFERARGDKTFTDFHGEALAQQLQRLCKCETDDQLPEVHGLLLKTAKGRTFALLGSLFAKRSIASPLPLNAATAPLATPKLVEDVFRNYAPGGDGLTFGKGLTPFAIICPGHDGFQQAQRAVQQAQMLESGTSVTLADAQVLLTDDARFPTEAFVAVEKLQAWSVVVDVFHGENHPIAESLRSAVLTMGPQLQRMAAHMGDTKAAGMELIFRVMYDMQQDYFDFLARAALDKDAVPPTFQTVIGLVVTYRANGLSPLPPPWYLALGGPVGRAAGGVPSAPLTAPIDMRVNTPSAQVVNPHADRRLMNRFRDCGHSAISAMIGTHSVVYPKQGGKDICLAWALKGSCSSNCRRVAQHTRYNAATMAALHTLLDVCGVPSPAST
jgi:hypothetical protein